MIYNISRRTFVATVAILFLVDFALLFKSGSCIPVQAQEQAVSIKPAHELKTTPVLDLSKFPVMKGASVRQQSLARLSYEVPHVVKEAFRFQAQELAKLGWKQLKGGYESDRSRNATFEKEGYRLSLSVNSAGVDGKSNVLLTQHGNIDLEKIPLPGHMKLLFSGPASVS